MKSPKKKDKDIRGELVLAAIAAFACFFGAFGFYWAIDALWILAFGVFLPGLWCFLVSVAASVMALFRKSWPQAMIPIAINAVTALTFIATPWSDVSMHTDFAFKKQAMVKVAQNIQAADWTGLTEKSEAPDAAWAFIEIPLEESDRRLAARGNVAVFKVSCGRYVFFPTFRGIPDGVGGFLFVPRCGSAREFPGGRWGAVWYNVSSLGDGWYRMDGT